MHYSDYLNLVTDLALSGDIKLCVVGQDPYEDYKACGIAFCTNTFEQLLDGYTCGEKVLISLGINNFDAVKEDFDTPIQLFYYLAKNEGIAFVNLSRFRGQLSWGNYNHNKSIIENTLHEIGDLINNSGNIVLLGKSFRNEFKDLIDGDFEVIIHPSGKASQNSDYAEYWDGNNYLERTYL